MLKIVKISDTISFVCRGLRLGTSPYIISDAYVTAQILKSQTHLHIMWVAFKY